MPETYLCGVCRDPVVDAPQEQWTSTAVVAGGWRHLDDSPLCPGGAPTRVEEPDPADPDTAALAAMLPVVFAPHGPYTPARAATALAALDTVTGWLRMATGPACASRTAPQPADLARLVAGLLRAARSQAATLINLRRHLDDRARTGHPADVARDGRAAGRLTHAADRQAAVAADLAAVWLAARHTSRQAPDPACGCPPACAGCRETVGTLHDPHCPWALGSVDYEHPAIAAEPTVLPAHLHRPGCPQAVPRPGGLCQQITADGDLQCLICAAVNTIDADSFDSYGATTEHHQRCTFCGTTWSWCDMSAVR